MRRLHHPNGRILASLRAQVRDNRRHRAAHVDTGAQPTRHSNNNDHNQRDKYFFHAIFLLKIK
jgi:hypothetical protein